MILVNFDVIALPGEELGARTPDQTGMRLWQMFHNQHRGHVGLVVNLDIAHEDKDILETWLTREGVKAAFYEAVGPNPAIREEKIHRLSTLYGKADWYVDSDVEMCVRLLKLGVPSFVYANPQIIRPEWHDDPTPRPWDELAAELDRQATVLQTKNWGDVESNTA